MAKATIHFMVDDATAQIPFMRPNTQTRIVEKGFCRPACQGNKATMPKHATGEADSVTCPKCKATDQWKEAMAALLTEREVELTDPAWTGLPMTAEQQAELAELTKPATTVAPVVTNPTPTPTPPESGPLPTPTVATTATGTATK